MRSFRRVRTDDRTINDVQDSIEGVIRPLVNNQELDGPILLKNVTVKADGSPVVVAHQLGRVLVGWRVVRLRGPAVVYDAQDRNPTPDRTLILKAVPVPAGAVTSVEIDLVVF